MRSNVKMFKNQNYFVPKCKSFSYLALHKMTCILLVHFLFFLILYLLLFCFAQSSKFYINYFFIYLDLLLFCFAQSSKFYINYFFIYLNLLLFCFAQSSKLYITYFFIYVYFFLLTFFVVTLTFLLPFFTAVCCVSSLLSHPLQDSRFSQR
jgi:hypothetical protein